MDIKLLDYVPGKKKPEWGLVTIQYKEFTMRLRVRCYRNRKIYIEMPRYKDSKDNIIYSMKWTDQRQSDKFQQLVIEKIKEKYPGVLNIKEKIVKNT